MDFVIHSLQMLLQFISALNRSKSNLNAVNEKFTRLIEFTSFIVLSIASFLST